MSVNDGGYKTHKNSTEQIFCENITNDHGQEKKSWFSGKKLGNFEIFVRIVIH